MAFTQVTVLGNLYYTRGSGEEDLTFTNTGNPITTGAVSFTPSVAITNGGVTVSPTPATIGYTDTNGAFSVTINANDDAGTTPTGTYYTVAIHDRSTRRLLQTRNVIVSSANAPTVALTTLPDYVPAVASVGRSIIGISLVDVQAKAAAYWPTSTTYFFNIIDTSGTLLDFGSGDRMTAATGIMGTLAKLGGHDDGSADGVAGTKVIHQGLVKLPISTAQESISSGSYVVAANAANADGTQTAWTLTLAAPTTSVSSGSAWVERTLYGNRIGVRFRRSNSATLPPLSLIVDGVTYPIRNVANRRHAVTVLSAQDYETLFLVADDLGPGPHTVRFSMASDIVGGGSHSVIFYGWLVDRAAGYEDKPRGSFVSAPTAMPTASTAMTTTGFTGLVKQITFDNTDASPHTVTITSGGTTVRRVPVAATTSVDFALPVPVQVSAIGWRWSCDSALVNYTIQEQA